MNARKRKVSEDEEDEFPYGPSKYRTLERDPLEEVVDMIANTKSCSFVWAKRIEYSELTEQIIVSHIFEQGLPLVCSNTTKSWNDYNRNKFSKQWLLENCSNVPMCPGPRDIERLEDIEGWTVGEYIEYTQDEETTPPNKRSKPKKKSLPYPILYGKDMPVPQPWRDYINKHIKPFLSYKTGGDVLGELPKSAQIDTNMMYVGYHGTQTPSHCDRIGTFGQNLIVYADSPDTSCLWFMAATKDQFAVEKFFQEQSKNYDKQVSIHNDDYFVPIDQLQHAPYPVYVIDQKEGDLVLVPPRGAHQAINRGPGLSIKFAWSRMPVYQLENVVKEIIPFYRKVGREEVYRVLASTWFGLCNRITQLSDEGLKTETKNELVLYLPYLLKILEYVAQKEWVDSSVKLYKYNDETPFMRFCDCCHVDIFNRCFHHSAEDDDVDICLDCVVEGKLNEHKDKEFTVYENVSRSELESKIIQGWELYAKETSTKHNREEIIQRIINETSVAMLGIKLAKR